MKTNTILTIIFALVVVAVLIGEVYVYTVGQERYSSDISLDGNELQYSVMAKGSQPYSVLVLDNNTFDGIDSYYIYYDANYGSKLEKIQVPIGAKELTQEYYISQLVKMLNNRGINDIEILNAAKLRDAMTSDEAGGSFSKGLIVLSGALPDTIYDNVKQSNSPIFEWIKAGGSLYWAGNLLGAYYSDANGEIFSVSFDYETAFFGQSDCLNIGDENSELSDIVSNDYRHTLSLMNNRIRYGVTSLMEDHLAIGYTDGTYNSATMVELGAGMVCVLAGDYSNNQRHDLAQIIVSGICHSTEESIKGYAEGNVKKGTVTGKMDVNFDPSKNYTVYIYYGGYFPVYGKTWRVENGIIV